MAPAFSLGVKGFWAARGEHHHQFSLFHHSFHDFY